MENFLLQRDSGFDEWTVMTYVDHHVGLSRPTAPPRNAERLNIDRVRGGARPHELTRRATAAAYSLPLERL
jgi:hypothetical protein